MRYIVHMESEDNTELMYMEIAEFENLPPDDASFSVGVRMERDTEVSAYVRTVHHVNTLKASPLGILQAALDELPQEAMKRA